MAYRAGLRADKIRRCSLNKLQITPLRILRVWGKERGAVREGANDLIPMNMHYKYFVGPSIR